MQRKTVKSMPEKQRMDTEVINHVHASLVAVLAEHPEAEAIGFVILWKYGEPNNIPCAAITAAGDGVTSTIVLRMQRAVGDLIAVCTRALLRMCEARHARTEVAAKDQPDAPAAGEGRVTARSDLEANDHGAASHATQQVARDEV